MPTTYTSLLGLALPATGELAGTWGTTVNDSITELVEDAIAATATFSVTSGNWTLSTTGSGAANEARCAILIPTGTPGVSRNIIAPSQSKAYIVINQSNAAVVLKGAATTGVTIATGTEAVCAWNGSDFVVVATADIGNLSGTLLVANGGTGQTSYTDGQLLIGNSTGNTLTKATLTAGSGVSITNGTGSITISATGSGGDVVGPASATDNAIVRFDLTTGKLIQNSVVTIADSTGNIAGAGSITSIGASGILTRAAATQDAVAIVGRAGGSSSFAVTLTPATLSSSTTLTLPNVTDTVATIGAAQTFTGANTFRTTSGTRFEEASGQDAIIVDGRAGGSSSFAITLTPATLSASRTFTLPDPGENVTVGYLNIPQNSQSAAYTLVATDSGKQIFHPSADTTARIFTIPANSSVPYAIGTAITFINQNGAGVVTIAITTDTMRLAGAGTTGSRTLAANGIATCIKVTSTEWIISGTGLT